MNNVVSLMDYQASQNTAEVQYMTYNHRQVDLRKDESKIAKAFKKRYAEQWMRLLTDVANK